MQSSTLFQNPFRPGAGQKPPHLAGRENEKMEFKKLLRQKVVTDNLIVTGLRGTGKTVLLDTFKPLALENNWTWVGSDLSESACVSERHIAVRLLTDLSVITSQISVGKTRSIGFASESDGELITLSYVFLMNYFDSQPGLVSDKLKSTLEFVWQCATQALNTNGVVFAYDESQNMSDKARENEYPLSVLLDVFQSLQRKEIPFLLVLVGLPTLFPKLVDARTYAERMFNIIELKSLTPKESEDAIKKPIDDSKCPVKFDDASIGLIYQTSGGYPYFIQFICRESYDSFLLQIQQGIANPNVPVPEIVAKLDTEFFSGRWNNLTDRQRELLSVVCKLKTCGGEFAIQEVVELSKEILKPPMGASQINQFFSKLMDFGLVYRTRHGKYTLGIPLLAKFIERQHVLEASSKHV